MGRALRLSSIASVVLALVALNTPWASSTDPTINECHVPTANSVPQQVAKDADGNAWFTELGGNKVAKVSPDCTFNEYPVQTPNSNPNGIALGPDGNMWFTEYNASKVASVTPTGTITEYNVGAGPEQITAGPDGAMWFTERFIGKIGRITTSGQFTDFPVASPADLYGITAGPDGNLWYSDYLNSTVGRMTTAGVVTNFPLSNANAHLGSITSGPDGNLWFTEFDGNAIGRITTAGVITEFPVPTGSSQPDGITTGPDGALWFTEFAAAKLGRITTGGQITETSLPGGSGPQGLADPDGNYVVVAGGDQNSMFFAQIPVCSVHATDGSFEPVQGPFQDDPKQGNFFADKPGKEISELPPLGNEFDRFDAELDMVRNRPTVLTGIDHVSNEEPNDTPPKDHYDIVINGTSNCTTKVPVKMKFTLLQGGMTPIYTSQALADQIPLDPPVVQTASTWTVKLPAPKGIPPPGDHSFTFLDPGPYTILDELIRADNDQNTGMFMTVEGNVVDTHGPTTAFVPVVASATTAALVKHLKKASDDLAAESRTEIPDYYPVAPFDFPVIPMDTKNLTAYVGKEQKKWSAWSKSVFGAVVARQVKSDARQASVDRLFRELAQLSKGVQRVVVMFSTGDFDGLMPLNRAGAPVKTHDDLAGFATSQKVVIVHTQTPVPTVAHELVHTMPYLWSSPEMQALCDVDYHNAIVEKNGHKTAPKWAHAIQITQDSAESAGSRIVHDPEVSIMGPAGPPRWIDQCTYWHMLTELQNIPDPPVLLVDGRLARNGTKIKGQLLPSYQQDAPADLSLGAPGPGQYSIVLKDLTGAALGTYPFTAYWDMTDGIARKMLAFGFRVPDPGGVGEIDLVGPKGQLLSKKTLSANPPVVSITTPTDGAQATVVRGRVHIEWTGSDPDGDPLLYTVLYSDDNGQHLIAQSIEQTGTSFDVRIGHGHDHQVEVLVTDGVRTAQSLISFTTP